MNLQERIRDAGVVGAGGAGFPAHVKAGSNVEYVIGRFQPFVSTRCL